MMDALGTAVTAYRTTHLSAKAFPLPKPNCRAQISEHFLTLAQTYIEQTLRANQRPDGLYHAYNILQLGRAGKRRLNTSI